MSIVSPSTTFSTFAKYSNITLPCSAKDYQTSMPYTLVMNQLLIKELERALRRLREKMLDYSDQQLIEIQNMLNSAKYSTSLEIYSREAESLKVDEPELV